MREIRYVSGSKPARQAREENNQWRFSSPRVARGAKEFAIVETQETISVNGESGETKQTNE